MYILISVTRNELDICESFHKTQEDARKAMVEDMLLMTNYETIDDIIDDADAGFCGFSDNDAWAETKSCGTAQWKIVQIPD